MRRLQFVFLLACLSLLAACARPDAAPGPDNPPTATGAATATLAAVPSSLPAGPTATQTPTTLPAAPAASPPVPLPGRLPDQALVRLGSGSISALAAGQDLLALGGTAGVCLYDEPMLTERWCVYTERPVRSLALSPEAGRLAIGLNDGQLLLWDVPGRSEIGRRRIGLYEGPSSLEFSPDGRTLVVAIPGKLSLWDGLALSEEQQRLSTTAAFFAPVRFSPDGRYLAWIEHPQTRDSALIYDLQRGEAAAEFELPYNAQGLDWTPDGQQLLVGLAGGPDCYENCTPSYETDGVVLSYSPAEAETKELRFDYPDRAVRDMALSPDGLHLALQVGLYEPRLLLADVRRGQPLELPVRLDPYRQSLTWSQSGLYFLDEAARLYFWGRSEQNAVDVTPPGYSQPPAVQALSPAGTRLAEAYNLPGAPARLAIYSLPEGAVLAEWEAASAELFDLSWSPDGGQLALLDYHTLEIYDLSNSQARQLLSLGPDENLAMLAWSLDGAALVVGVTHFREGTTLEEILVLQAEDGAQLDRLEISENLGGASFNLAPDGRRLAVHAWSRQDATAELAVWDLEAGRRLNTLELDFGLYAFAWSPEDDTLAAFQDRSLIRLDTSSGNVLWNRSLGPLHQEEHGAARLAFSPDGRWLVTAGREVALWAADSGERVQVYEGHSLPVQQIAFSADGRQLITASEDGTVIVWELP